MAHQLSFQYTPIVMLANASTKLFGEEFHSPFLSYAPKVQDASWCTRLTACLMDRSVALQTVDESTLHDRWLKELLVHVGRTQPLPVLIQMPLKRYGKPVINEIATALELLKDGTIDYLVVEDTMFVSLVR